MLRGFSQVFLSFLVLHCSKVTNGKQKIPFRRGKYFSFLSLMIFCTVGCNTVVKNKDFQGTGIKEIDDDVLNQN